MRNVEKRKCERERKTERDRDNECKVKWKRRVVIKEMEGLDNNLANMTILLANDAAAYGLYNLADTA